MKRLLILIILIMTSFSQAQALVIGVAPNSPPLSSLADKQNHFYGFEIDLINNICLRIKLPCTLTPVFIKQVQPDLMAQKIDLAIEAYIIPNTPPPGFIFSLPYLPSNAEFIVEKNSTIMTPADIQNKTVGVRHGTLFDDLLHTLYGNKVSISKYMTGGEVLSALTNGNVDAILTDSVVADFWMLNSGGEYRLIGKKIPIGNGYGILANMGQEALMAKINQALQSMMADGTYSNIYSRYF